MFRSMTGFGSSSIKTKAGLLEIEIGSVNRKHFECMLFLPREWLSLEIEAKKAIGKKVSRGQVTLRANFYPSAEGLKEKLPQVELLKKLKEAWEEKALALGLSKKEIDLDFLASQLRVFPKYAQKEESIDQTVFFKALSQALKKLQAMKEKEGQLLEKDILARLLLVKKILVQIEKKAENSAEKYAEKLKKRLLKLDLKEDERLLKEIALFAEKVDITEELVRLESHLKQFGALNQAKEPVGRKMDFLLQEMGREINTIASKASDSVISAAAVNIKSELEKIREQVQNIE